MLIKRVDKALRNALPCSVSGKIRLPFHQNSCLNVHVKDLRTIPAYPFAEAARLLRVPQSTLRYWFNPTKRHKRRGDLCFLELLEGYVIQLLRSKHQVPMRNISKAIEYWKRETNETYPLATKGLGVETDGTHLFFQKFGQLICASQAGQLAMKQLLESFLERVEYGSDDLAIRFYPLTRDFRTDSPKYIVVDPKLNFGRPCLVERGIRTSIIASRYVAGESAQELAEDYDCDAKWIDEAIRSEFQSLPSAA